MRNADYLFTGTESHQAVAKWQQQFRNEIDSQPAYYILNVSEKDYLDHIIDKYSIIPPILHLHKKEVEIGDAQIDVAGRFDYAVDRDEGPRYVKGTTVKVSIPFEGNPKLLNLQLPSTYYQSPKGSIDRNRINLTYSRLPQDHNTIKGELANDTKRLECCFTELRSIIEQFNSSLESIGKEAISKRKTKLLVDSNLVESLGIPLKKIDGDSPTYTIPLARKKIVAVKPAVVKKRFTPEPTMLPDDYEAVLELIKHLSLVIERNPHTFVSMKEPDIRNIILVLLNAVYQGTATGETFNGTGKSDILIRYEGQNLFVAECKFWKGEKQLLEAIDQLIGYVAWRDTKTALIMFNRKKDFTATLSKLQEVTKNHKCYKKYLGVSEETVFRYRFCRPDDSNREFFLTILAFIVPDRKSK
jgi:hypothetical protein